MGDMDRDRPGRFSSAAPQARLDSRGRSATGQRIKGGAKNIAGEIANDEKLEEKGERENAAGRERQKDHDAV